MISLVRQGPFPNLRSPSRAHRWFKRSSQAGSNSVDVYVGYLRKKVGGDLIKTVRGMGYRLEASQSPSFPAPSGF